MPGTPVCQLGLVKKALAPPPPALRPFAELSSFHTTSGMYWSAELMASWVELVASDQ